MSAMKLKPSKGLTSIIYNCTCNQQSTMVNLIVFIKDFKDKQVIENDPKCIAHNTKNANKYCCYCSKWLCRDCSEVHQQSNYDHLMTEYEIKTKCVCHNMPYSYYCYWCNVAYCGRYEHFDHDIKPFFKNIQPQLNAIKAVLFHIKQTVFRFIESIDDSNSNGTQMREAILLAYYKNKQINDDLIVLYKSLHRTVLSNCIKPSLQRSIRINMQQYINKDLPINEEFTKLHEYLQTNYVLKQTKNDESNTSFFLTYGAIMCFTELTDGRFAYGSQYTTNIELKNIFTDELSAYLIGHNNVVLCLVVLTDGRLASGSYDNTIKLWNTSTLECTTTFIGHKWEINSLSALQCDMVASGSGDRTIKLWNTSTNVLMATLTGHKNDVNSVVVLPNNRLASGSNDSTIKIWNLYTNSCIVTLIGHKNYVTCVVLLTDGRLASGSYDYTIKLWCTLTYQCTTTIKGYSDSVLCLAVMDNGIIAFGACNKTITLYNTVANKCSATLTGSRKKVLSLIVLLDGRLASTSYDQGTIQLWDSKFF